MRHRERQRYGTQTRRDCERDGEKQGELERQVDEGHVEGLRERKLE